MTDQKIGPWAALRQRAERIIQAAQGFEPDPVRGGYSTADHDTLNPVQRVLQDRVIDRHERRAEEAQAQHGPRQSLEDRLRLADAGQKVERQDRAQEESRSAGNDRSRER